MEKKSKPKSARKVAAKKAGRVGAATAKPKAKSRSAAAKSQAKTKAKARTTPARAKKSMAKSTRPAKTRANARQTSASRRRKTAARASAPVPPSVEVGVASDLDAGGAAEHEPFEIGPSEIGPSEIAPDSAALGQPGARRNQHGETPAESGEVPPRANKLVPTNAVHTTKRRTKRNTWQGPTLGLAAMAAVLAILVLGHESAPPDVSPLERRAEVRPSDPAPRVQDPFQATPDRGRQAPVRIARPAMPRWSQEPERPGEKGTGDAKPGLKVLDLVEMERMLARLEMGPSQPDGIVDRQTESAIRMYQQIAGLPIDGEPSAELLDDMREVVKLMDGTN